MASGAVHWVRARHVATILSQRAGQFAVDQGLGGAAKQAGADDPTNTRTVVQPRAVVVEMEMEMDDGAAGGGAARPREDPLRALLAECKLMQYYENLKEEGFELLEDLTGLTEEDLRECGINKRAYRRRILTRVRAMNT